MFGAADAQLAVPGQRPSHESTESTLPTWGAEQTELVRQLADALGSYRRWVVLTGAGCSTASGLVAYRDDDGRWQHPPPLQYSDFVASEAVRQRYWARSAAGYEVVARARPGRAHVALRDLERLGRVNLLITQNVDSLHTKAGSQHILELHGALRDVECMACGDRRARGELQERLLSDNPHLSREIPSGPALRPDGDAAVLGDSVVVPLCQCCGGTLKPAVTFFGETVGTARTERANAAIDGADALLVVGSSLTVFSGFRLVRRAALRELPIVVVNRGVTRADGLCSLKVPLDCNDALPLALDLLAADGG